MTKREILNEIQELEALLAEMKSDDHRRWAVLERIAELKESLRRLRRLEELER